MTRGAGYGVGGLLLSQVSGLGTEGEGERGSPVPPSFPRWAFRAAKKSSRRQKEHAWHRNRSLCSSHQERPYDTTDPKQKENKARPAPCCPAVKPRNPGVTLEPAPVKV